MGCSSSSSSSTHACTATWQQQQAPQQPQQQPQQQHQGVGAHQQQQQQHQGNGSQQQQQQQHEGWDATVLAAHAAMASAMGPQMQMQQQQEANQSLGEALMAVTSNYSTCAKAQMDKMEKPKDSAQFTQLAKDIWTKVRTTLDHAHGSVDYPPMGVDQVGEELFNTLNRMGVAADMANVEVHRHIAAGEVQ
jgi:hypothetical protein